METVDIYMGSKRDKRDLRDSDLKTWEPRETGESRETEEAWEARETGETREIVDTWEARETGLGRQ